MYIHTCVQPERPVAPDQEMGSSVHASDAESGMLCGGSFHRPSFAGGKVAFWLRIVARVTHA